MAVRVNGQSVRELDRTGRPAGRRWPLRMSCAQLPELGHVRGGDEPYDDLIVIGAEVPEDVRSGSPSEGLSHWSRSRGMQERGMPDDRARKPHGTAPSTG